MVHCHVSGGRVEGSSARGRSQEWAPSCCRFLQQIVWVGAAAPEGNMPTDLKQGRPLYMWLGWLSTYLPLTVIVFVI